MFDLTQFIENFLTSLNIMPTSYLYFFPSDVDIARLNNMVETGVFPTVPKLAPALTSAIYLSIARFFLHRLLFKPLGTYLMNIKFRKQEKNDLVDKAFPTAPKENQAVVDFCASSKLNKSDVFRYLWDRKRNKIMAMKLTKFSEATWRLIFYAYFVVIGYYALFTPSTASWIVDTNNHWVGWPYHPMSKLLEFYYQAELGCYLHQLLWTEVSRSDSLEMIVHHLTTIALMVTSYLTNFTRVGASILLLHDTADCFLEGAKIANYINKGAKVTFVQTITKICCDSLFVCFAVTFFVTRLIFYPRYILWSVYAEASVVLGTDWLGYKAFLGMLSILQCLHIFWFYLISKMIVGLIMTAGVAKDVRSDDDEDIGEFVEDDKDK